MNLVDVCVWEYSISLTRFVLVGVFEKILNVCVLITLNWQIPYG